MKKLLTFSLIAILGAASTRADDSNTSRTELVSRVNSCETVLRQFMASANTAIPPSVWQQAPRPDDPEPVQGGLSFRRQGRLWSQVMGQEAERPSGAFPSSSTPGEASLGLQIGAKDADTVFVITDDATPRLLFTNRLNIGVDAKAVIGPSSAEVESDAKTTFAAPVLVYTNSVGLFAGATVKAGHVQRNDVANFTLYNTTYTMPELLYSDWVTPPPEVQPLMAYVQQLSP